MRALAAAVFALSTASTIVLSAACGKEPERPVSEASADAEALAIDAWVPDAASAVVVSPDAAPTASASSSSPPPAADAGDGLTTSSSGTVVTDTDTDRTVDLAKGQTLTVLLTSNPTSGFDWSITKAPKALGTPEVSFEKGAPGVMGASGKRKLVFTLKEPLPAGEHAVELGYARSFEKGVAPFKTFKFKVRAAK